jgi:hypothetical protein
MRYVSLCAGALLLAGCGMMATQQAGRMEPGGSFADPLCMPDGSVVYYEYANKNGQYDEVTASKANCPWSRSRNVAGK